MAEGKEVDTTPVEEVDERRQIELEILEAAAKLRSFELGSIRRGVGRLSVGRASRLPDDHIHTIIEGAGKLTEYDEKDQQSD